jgi:hypothetical protein
VPQAGSQMVWPGCGAMTSTMAAMSGRGREVLAGAALHVLGVLLQQALVGVALHIGVEGGPLLLVDEVHDQPAELGGSWILFCALRKMMPSMPGTMADDWLDIGFNSPTQLLIR